MKNELSAKVPDYVKDTPEWSVFLKWLSEKSIKTNAQLKSVLNAEIKECEVFLKKNMSGSREGTNTRVVRQCAKKLDFLKLARDKIVKYI